MKKYINYVLSNKDWYKSEISNLPLVCLLIFQFPMRRMEGVGGQIWQQPVGGGAKKLRST